MKFLRKLLEIIIVSVIIVVFLVTCAGGAKSATSSGDMTLDEAIAEAAIRIDERTAAGTKIAPINFNSPSDKFSAYVLDELTANLVDSGKLTVVDRNEIDLIRKEFDFQYSGDVGDDSMQTLGKMLGAQSIISGSLTDMGGFYRIVIRVLNVQNASVEVQYRTNIVIDNIVTALLTGGKSGGTSTASSGSGGGKIDQSTQTMPQTNNPVITTPPIEGTIVPGSSLADKLAWLQRSADSHNTYVIVVNANETIAPHVFEYRGAINVTVILRGDSLNRIIRLRSHGMMFRVNPNVTLVLDNDIIIQGHSGNSAAMIDVYGGTFKMNGSNITSNAKCGVFVADGGTFIMDGGTISGNSSHEHGGGVIVESGGIFIMHNGTISGNTADCGGGVYINRGIFTMNGGTISGNIAKGNGGGIDINGGNGGTFNMTGGTITGNIARGVGGGLVLGRGTFTKTGGAITGYNSDSNNGNVVKDIAGNVLARKGHAVYAGDVKYSKQKETTAGQGVSLSFNGSNGGYSGAWDF